MLFFYIGNILYQVIKTFITHTTHSQRSFQCTICTYIQITYMYVFIKSNVYECVHMHTLNISCSFFWKFSKVFYCFSFASSLESTSYSYESLNVLPVRCFPFDFHNDNSFKMLYLFLRFPAETMMTSVCCISLFEFVSELNRIEFTHTRTPYQIPHTLYFSNWCLFPFRFLLHLLKKYLIEVRLYENRISEEDLDMRKNIVLCLEFWSWV